MKFEARMLLAALAGCMSFHPVLAAYPERPIRMIVPSAAGGQPDTNSRLVAAELGKQIGQQVVVDNRPGASSSIGFEAIARAQPDGYTIGYGGFPLATNPSFARPGSVRREQGFPDGDPDEHLDPTSSPSRRRCP